MRDILNKLVKEDFRKIVISNPLSKEQPYQKMVITPKLIGGKELCQLEKRTSKQVFHENFPRNELADVLFLQMQDFRQLNYFGNQQETEIRLSRKGKALVSSRKAKHDVSAFLGNNRQKTYLLKEGERIEPLIDLGIFTKDGKVVASMYDKYRQINRFVELIDDALKQDESTELTILDFGCGKSYLTFIVYYYLVKIKGIKAHIIGLDLKEEVIAKCNQTAAKYGYDDLHFEIGDIANYRYQDKVDMVITLHACDTATDFALFNVIRWHARYIFSVPCCQHELNAQIKSEDYNILLRYGLIKERVAALFTDALRANTLGICGYKTQVIEFIDFSHSPKNILLRATAARILATIKQQLRAENEQLCTSYQLKPTLIELLKKEGLYDVD